MATSWSKVVRYDWSVVTLAKDSGLAALRENTEMPRKSSRRSQASKRAARRRWAKGRSQPEEFRDGRGANNGRTATRVQCPHCGHLYESHVQQLRHLAACHRDYLDATEVGRLGKVILYQSTARLFHCARCFYTFKDFSKLFVHLITKHCMEEEEERGRQGRSDEVGQAIIRKDEVGIKGAVEEKLKDEEIQESEVKAEMEMEEKEETLEATGVGEGVQLLDQNCAPLRPRPMEDGYCCPACDYKHQLETDVVEHLERCHGVQREDPTHAGKKEDEVEEEEEEEKGEKGVEGSAHQPNDQPTLKAKDSVSKYISYTSCRYSCRLCGYCAKTKGRILSHVHRSHEVNGPYKCHECSATFLLPVYLQQHASSAHRPCSYLCPFCDSRSRSPLILRLHCTRCRGCRGSRGAEEGQLEGMDIGSDCPLGEEEKQEEVEKQESNGQDKEQKEN